MSEVIVKALAAVPDAAVVRFFDGLPEGDRTFFKEPVQGDETVAAWRMDERAQRVVALDGDVVVGYVAVIPGVGWSSHVGELRVVVDPGRRGAGLGRRLAHEGLTRALSAGMSKVVAEQADVIALFQRLGFVPEALLEDHVRDGSGRLADLIVLAHRADETASALATVGLGDELG